MIKKYIYLILLVIIVMFTAVGCSAKTEEAKESAIEIMEAAVQLAGVSPSITATEVTTSDDIYSVYMEVDYGWGFEEDYKVNMKLNDDGTFTFIDYDLLELRTPPPLNR